MVDDRYSRQALFEPIGQSGCERIRNGKAVLVGCGALGSTMANALVRAGIGRLRLIDSDRLELSNLQRQTLYDETQVRAGAMKAKAASQRLASINGEVVLEPIEARLQAANVEQLIGRPDLVLDGSDNFAARYLINDYCVREGIPWIYGGCAASYGVVMPILPGRTPCLRCIFIEPPPPEHAATADTVGIIGPIAHLIASVQGAEALKLLSGNAQAIRPSLYTVDLWQGTWNVVRLGAPEPNCPCCGQHRFDFLEGDR